MTTIAWDGMTLAGDRCSWSSGVRRTVKKVHKVTAPDGRRYLVGFTGDGDFCMAVLAWMKGEGERPAYADFGVDAANQFAVVIDEEMKVWALSANLKYSRFYEQRMAYGAGQDMAWGALEAGADAKTAIQIVARRSDYAGLGVDCVRF